jgi:hypothetical protein
MFVSSPGIGRESRELGGHLGGDFRIKKFRQMHVRIRLIFLELPAQAV